MQEPDGGSGACLSSPDLPRARQRLVLARVALAAALVLGGSACDGAEPAPTPTTATEVEVTRSVSALPSYCEVQALRQMIAEGEVARSQLPAWADMTEADGTPRIVDFRRAAESHAAVLDDLFNSPGLEDVRVSQRIVRECLATTTEDDVVRTQNGHGHVWYDEYGGTPLTP